MIRQSFGIAALGAGLFLAFLVPLRAARDVLHVPHRLQLERQQLCNFLL